MQLMQKIIAASALALNLGLAFSTAASAQENSAPLTNRQLAQQEYDRRIEMINALEVTHDDAKLADLVRTDKDLDSYYRVLSRACVYLKDAALAKKLLDLPALDRNSADYKRAVENVFAYIAGNNEETTPEIKALLFDRIKDDQSLKDEALRSIFETAAIFYGETMPNVETTRLLIRNGADLDGAIANVTAKIRDGSHPLLQGFPEQRLARVEKFKAAVTAPSQTPAPQAGAQVRHLQF